MLKRERERERVVADRKGKEQEKPVVIERNSNYRKTRRRRKQDRKQTVDDDIRNTRVVKETQRAVTVYELKQNKSLGIMHCTITISALHQTQANRHGRTVGKTG